MAIVYVHVFPNGKRYVGITTQKPSKRWQRGKNYTHNLHLERAIKKYGWDNIKHIIIGEYRTAEEAGEVEKDLIKKHHLQNPAYGYNISYGGEHGTHSEETKKKLSDSRKGSGNPMYGRRGKACPRYGKTSPMLGRKMSEEAKRKISAANTGKSHPVSESAKEKIRIKNSGANNKNSIKVLCVETGIVYASSGEASRMTGCHQGNISECCNGTHKTTGGYHWRYADG